MKKIIFFITVTIVCFGIKNIVAAGISASPSNTVLTITSSAFDHKGNIPTIYTCDGENINPPLTISSVPNNAKSLVLIVDDPDAPKKTWVHWVVWNIPPTTKEIPQNGVPGSAGITDFGTTGYGGPCPPSGTHRYFFKLYALDTLINLPKEATKKEVEEAIQGHIIAKAELIGLYQRTKK